MRARENKTKIIRQTFGMDRKKKCKMVLIDRELISLDPGVLCWKLFVRVKTVEAARREKWLIK